MTRAALYRPGVLSRSLEEFEERKLEEIYANLRKQRADLEQQWARKERLRAETRAKAKVGYYILDAGAFLFQWPVT